MNKTYNRIKSCQGVTMRFRLLICFNKLRDLDEAQLTQKSLSNQAFFVGQLETVVKSVG